MEKIFGINPVVESIKKGIVEEIFVDKYLKNKRLMDLIELARRKHIKISYLKKDDLTTFFSTSHHQGVGAILREINLFFEDELIESLSEDSVVVLLDGITDPHNLGAILRSCAAFGVDGVFIPKRKSASFSGYVWKSSAGAIPYLRISLVTNLSRTISKLKENFFKIVGAHTEGNKNLFECNLTKGVAIVLGSEGKGMRKKIVEKCDELIKIPIGRNVESLNVSVSAGIFLYEVMKQRYVKNKKDIGVGMGTDLTLKKVSGKE